MSVRLIKHEAIPVCGSYEVRADGKPSRHFYFDDLPARRLRPEILPRKEALEQAKAPEPRGTTTGAAPITKAHEIPMISRRPIWCSTISEGGGRSWRETDEARTTRDA